jgi:uncharacterized RDD family membrane protein YckC
VPLDNTAEVETPELVRFRYRVAGPARRVLAYLLDFLIRAAVLLVVGLMVELGFGHGARDASKGLILLALFVLEWGYYVLFETAAGGASPGKRALALRVVKEEGYPISFLDSVLRNLLRAADFLPAGYLLGVLSMVTDGRFRRLGDRVAGTMVVVEERGRVAEPLKLEPPASPAELEGLPQRPPLSAMERESIELFLRRTDLGPARRQELADMLAPALAKRMGVRFADSVRFLGLLHHRASAAVGGRGAGPR